MDMAAVLEVCLFYECRAPTPTTNGNRHARWAVQTDLKCDKEMPACPF